MKIIFYSICLIIFSANAFAYSGLNAKNDKCSYLEGTLLDTYWNLELDYADIGPWRNFEIHLYGSNLIEIIEDAHIAEIDQDGGELNVYHLSESSKSVLETAVKEMSNILCVTKDDILKELKKYLK